MGSPILARDIVIQVAGEDDGTGTPTWIEVGGLTKVTPNFGENEETADLTTMDSRGAYEQWIAQRGATFELEGLALPDAAGLLDPGQARCEEMAGEDMLGADSLGQIRFRYPTSTEWKVWNSTFSLGEGGGETNDPAAWACTLTKSGRTTKVTVA